MNFLAHIVPVVRDVRTPLIAGYLWLLTGWLAFGDRVPTEQEAASAETVWSQLERLIDGAGTVGVAAAVSLAAVLIGSLYVELFGKLLQVADANVLATRSPTRTLYADRARLRSAQAQHPDLGYLIDPVAAEASEAHLRMMASVQIAATALVIGADGSWVVGLLLGCSALMLFAHALFLEYRAADNWRAVEGNVDERADQLAVNTALAQRVRTLESNRRLSVAVEGAAHRDPARETETGNADPGADRGTQDSSLRVVNDREGNIVLRNVGIGAATVITVLLGTEGAQPRMLEFRELRAEDAFKLWKIQTPSDYPVTVSVQWFDGETRSIRHTMRTIEQ